MRKFFIIIFLLIIAFCGVVGYICYDFYQSSKESQAVQTSAYSDEQTNLQSYFDKLMYEESAKEVPNIAEEEPEVIEENEIPEEIQNEQEIELEPENLEPPEIVVAVLNQNKSVFKLQSIHLPIQFIKSITEQLLNNNETEPVIETDALEQNDTTNNNASNNEDNSSSNINNSETTYAIKVNCMQNVVTIYSKDLNGRIYCAIQSNALFYR